MILGDVSLNFGQLVAAALGIFVAIPTTLTLYAQRNQSEAKIWEGLFHAKEAEGVEMADRLTKLEAKVDILQSNFVGEVSKGVADGVIAHLKEMNRT